MSDTPNLGLPFIDGGQAQKHLTHNEALRLLDAAIQIAVLDMTRTAPPTSPAEGERHVVATGATAAWAGHAKAIATWQDGAWAFLVPKAGWCIWSIADDVMMAFNGVAWRDLRSLALDNAAHLGVNTAADNSNRLSVKSNAALFAAIRAADGGSGDMRLQLSKEAAANTASVLFADNYSGRAEFGLVGSDAFKLKVSADGAGWAEAFSIDPATGNLALPRGLALSGVSAPATLSADANDYAPAGLGAACVLQISASAARNISGLAGGSEGRVVSVINVGSQPVTLLDDSASSAAANRFALGGALTIAARQAAVLRYDGTAARWQALAGGLALRTDSAQALTAAQQAQARGNLGVAATNLLDNGDFRINQRSYVSGATLAAGAYGHDRWKAGAGQGTYGFTQLITSTTITIASSKTLIQIVEDVRVGGGAYVLSWSGTALGRLGLNGAAPSGGYAASPITVTGQAAGTPIAVEFNNGTLGQAKLEPGTLATPFAMRDYAQELSACLRYCWACNGVFAGIPPNAQNLYGAFIFPVPMRRAPVLFNGSFAVAIGGGNAGTVGYQATTPYTANLYNSSNNWSVGVLITLTGVFDAEL